MNKCTRCKFNYPDRVLLSHVVPVTVGVVCGICALEIVNEYGFVRTEFHGEMAEQARQDAIKARKDGTARRKR